MRGVIFLEIARCIIFTECDVY